MPFSCLSEETVHSFSTALFSFLCVCIVITLLNYYYIFMSLSSLLFIPSSNGSRHIADLCTIFATERTKHSLTQAAALLVPIPHVLYVCINIDRQTISVNVPRFYCCKTYDANNCFRRCCGAKFPTVLVLITRVFFCPLRSSNLLFSSIKFRMIRRARNNFSMSCQAIMEKDRKESSRQQARTTYMRL